MLLHRWEGQRFSNIVGVGWNTVGRFTSKADYCRSINFVHGRFDSQIGREFDVV